MGLALENIGQRDGRSAHIAVFGSSLVELPQVYRAAADRYDLIEVDIGLLPAPRCIKYVTDAPSNTLRCSFRERISSRISMTMARIREMLSAD